MSKDVDFVEAVQGRAKAGLSYKERIAEAGTDFKESQSLFVKSIDKAKRQITALASTADLDRHDEVILPEAFTELLPVYMKNPVVITSHQHRLETGSSSVVGNVVNAWINQQGLWVVIEFVEGTALGDEYWLLYSTKKQRAFSVGFIPKEHRYEERDGKSVYVLTKVELLEISCVSVGANREALSKSKQRKVDFVSEKRTLAELYRSDPDFDEKCQEFAEMILGVGATENETDFTELVVAENEMDFAELVRG